MSHLHKGFGLVEVVVGIALMLVFFLSLFGILRASLMLSVLTKAKASAVELASSQMEYLRGLSYDSLGTVGGIPPGTTPQMATTTIDGVSYAVRTLIIYSDDPADGFGVQDSNDITTDYKIGKVSVSYSINGLVKSIELISNFIPPSIESSTGGGTLSVHVVDAANANVGDASVRIVNASVSPSIDFTTFSNADGLVTIGGSATSSEYQIYVSRDGYSSAQTYARTAQNVNPSPGYLTVSKDQTTGATFFIDLLSTLSIAVLSPAITTSFSDSFANSSKLDNQNGVQVAGGSLVLANESLSGTANSIPVTPDYLNGWGILSANIETPPETSALIHVVDAVGVSLSDSVLPGNETGFSSFPVSLTNVSTINYPSLAISAGLTSSSTTTTPGILDWSLSYTEGPTPLPNVAFTLTGAKTIGTGPNDSPIYKTIIHDTTGADAVEMETLEWDSYSIALGSMNMTEICPTLPYSLAPASTTDMKIIAGNPTTNVLPIIVQNNASSTIANAKIILEKTGYAATVFTSVCGFAYFNGLEIGSYGATVSATGYATTTFPNIYVAGQIATTILILP